jgi:23S rRNA pseudouridine1911/1915/1917 synthase
VVDDYRRAHPDAEAAPTRTLVVPDDCAGMRLDQALARLVPEHSRSRLKSWIDEGRVALDGAIVAPRQRVSSGQSLVIREPADRTAVADAPQPIPLAIVFEDTSLIVVDKPAGLVVHPGAGNRSGTLLNALLHHAPDLVALPRAGIVHRLDKDTSGLMVVAKTAEAQTDLVRQLQSRSVSRRYLAVVRGDLARSLVVDAPIGRHPTERTTMAVLAKGKPARTHVDVLQRYGIATLVRCRLETGRTHQIRVHLASIGFPLVGDPVYGRGRTSGGQSALPRFARQALHAERLALLHPATGDACEWTAAPPEDFAELIAAIARAAPKREGG